MHSVANNDEPKALSKLRRRLRPVDLKREVQICGTGLVWLDANLGAVQIVYVRARSENPGGQILVKNSNFLGAKFKFGRQFSKIPIKNLEVTNIHWWT